MVLSDCIYVENRGSVSSTGRLRALRGHGSARGAGMNTLMLDDRIKAEQLKQEIRKLESDQGRNCRQVRCIRAMLGRRATRHAFSLCGEQKADRAG